MPEPPTNPPLSASQQWELAQKAKSAPEIAWRNDREHLESQREAPRLEQQYTPGGSVVKEVHSAEAQRREAEIKRINDALQKNKGLAKTDFNLDRER